MAYALPAHVLRYRLYAKAFSLSRKAMAVSIYHGANLEVCGGSYSLSLVFSSLDDTINFSNALALSQSIDIVSFAIFTFNPKLSKSLVCIIVHDPRSLWQIEHADYQ